MDQEVEDDVDEDNEDDVGDEDVEEGEEDDDAEDDVCDKVDVDDIAENDDDEVHEDDKEDDNGNIGTEYASPNEPKAQDENQNKGNNNFSVYNYEHTKANSKLQNWAVMVMTIITMTADARMVTMKTTAANFTTREEATLRHPH